MIRMKIILSSIAMLLLFSCGKQDLGEDQFEETFYVRNGDADMPVFMRGNKTSDAIIVLLHGGPGDSSVNYLNDNWARQLMDSYSFAFWDQRQQGNSHGKLDREETTLTLIVEDLNYVIKTLKIRYGADKRIFLMGHSWGGAVGTAYLQTSDYQNEIDGFIEISGGYDFPLINEESIKMMNKIGNEEIDKGKNVEKWEEILEFANNLDLNNISLDEALDLNSFAGEISSEKLIEDQYKIASTRNFTNASSDVSNGINVLMNAISIFVQKDLIEKALENRLSEDLEKIEIPTLLIFGKYDFKVPPSLGRLAFEKISSINKTLYIYEHSGHSPMNSDPDRFVDDVVAFIN